MNNGNGNVCSLNPTEKDNKIYDRMLDKLNELSNEIDVPFHNDPAFKEALEILQQTNPKDAVDYLRNLSCPLNQNYGGKGRRGGKKTRSKNSSRKMRKHKGKSLRLKRRGGTIPTSNNGNEGAGSPPEVEQASSQHSSRVKCYIRVFAKVTAAIAGVGYAGYWLLFPFLTSAIPAPCSGLTDQAFSGIMSIINKDMSCAARQLAYDNLVTNYVKGLTTVTGLSLGGMLWASPKLFGLFVSYLLSKECPQTYGTMTFEQLLAKWDNAINDKDVKEDLNKARSSSSGSLNNPDEQVATRASRRR